MHESHALHLSNISLPKRGIFFYLTHFSSDRKQRVSVTCPPPYRNDYRGSSSFPFAVSCTFRTCLPLAYRAVESPCLVLVAYRLRSRRVSAQSRRDRDWRRGGGCSSAFSQMEEAEVNGDDAGNLLAAAAASANHGQHGECLWKSASRALTRKHVSCCVNRSRLA